MIFIMYDYIFKFLANHIENLNDQIMDVCGFQNNVFESRYL